MTNITNMKEKVYTKLTIQNIFLIIKNIGIKISLENLSQKSNFSKQFSIKLLKNFQKVDFVPVNPFTKAITIRYFPTNCFRFSINDSVIEIVISIIVLRILETSFSYLSRRFRRFRGFGKFAKFTKRNNDNNDNNDNPSKKKEVELYKLYFHIWLWYIYKKYFSYMTYEEFLRSLLYLRNIAYFYIFLLILYSFIFFLNYLTKILKFKYLEEFFKSGKILYLKKFFLSFFEKPDLLFITYLENSSLNEELLCQLFLIAKYFGYEHAIQAELVFKTLHIMENAPSINIVYSQDAIRNAIKLARLLNLEKVSDTLYTILEEDSVFKILNIENKEIKSLKTFNDYFRYYVSLIRKKRIWNFRNSEFDFIKSKK